MFFICVPVKKYVDIDDDDNALMSEFNKLENML